MNILLIEDDAGLVELITAMLEELGISVMSAASGDEALAHLKKQTPDLMLLDYSLPDINGKELIETLIKLQTPPPPFIITTGQGDERIAVDMMKLGAMDYLVKDILFLEKLPNIVKRVIKEIESDGKLKQAEEAFIESELRFRAFINASNDLTFIKDDQFRYLFANEQTARFFNRTTDELIGKTDEELAKQSQIRPCKDSDKRALESNEQFTVEEQLGNRIFEVTKLPLQLPNNKKGIGGIMRDISERKRAQQALSEREEQYRAVVENIGDNIMRYDKNGRHTYANSSAIEATGLPEDQYIGKNHREMGFPEHLCELWEENIESVFTTGKQKNIEFDVDLANGAMTLDLQLNPEFSDDGKVQSVIGISHDITDRKLSEEKLRDTILNLDEAVRSGRIGLWNWDLKTNKVSFSHEWKRQIGYEDHELKDDFSEWQNRVHPEDLESTMAIIKTSIKDINQDHRTEFRLRHKDGSYRWILSQATFILNEDGPAKMLGSHIDITAQKKLEAELNQSQKMESIGTLAGGIAHDFNNILSSVLGFTELALDAVEKETTIAEDLQEVYTAGLRAKDLVQQILTFARQSDEKLKPIQISLIIKEVLKFIRSSMPTTIDIKQTLKSESLIMASSTQIHRIMMNLCTNAGQAMEDEGGTLEITLNDINFSEATNIEKLKVKPGNYVEIKISDTGCGIEPHIIEKIFEPYFTTKEKGEGTGMGLAMVHGIVETYGGEILVESVPGKGTAFLIYLPIARQSKVNLHYKAEELPTGQERILFVDDEIQITKMASRVLQQLGYSVTTKNSSIEALELFRSKPNDFDLVISDVTMPKMTGDQLSKELIMIRPDIPIILCTGYSKKLSVEKSSEIGIKALTYKPIVKEDLAKTVRSVLDGY